MFDLERETGLPIRFAWAMLPTICDREGRFKWRPRALKPDILPYDDCDFSRVLDAWLTRGLLVRYRVGDEWFGWLPTFVIHQVINNREAGSQIPSIEEAEEVIDNRKNEISTRAPRVPVASSTRLEQVQGEGKGRELERKGREGEHQPSRETTTYEPVPQNSDLMVEMLCGAHPKNLKPKKSEHEAMAAIIREAQKFGGTQGAYEYLLGRTKLYAEMTAAWSEKDQQFIVSAEVFFRDKCYQVDEKLWVKGVSVDAAVKAAANW